MKKSEHIGANKTGLGVAPRMSKELLDNQDDQFKPLAQAEEDPLPELSFREIKQNYIEESGSIGTVPPPTTIKGAAVTVLQKITAKNPEVLVDKLGERLAFERSGARLYEAFILKCEMELSEDEVSFLRIIHTDEISHFEMLVETMKELGADPTAVTPCADVIGVASKGLIAVVNDPRTSIAQSASAILTAELVDNDGWDMLIDLTREAGLTEIAERFTAAKQNEERHLLEIRNWLKQLVSANDVTQLH